MTDEIIAFKGELWLLRWNESHNNGATVTFQLADNDDLEAFKRLTVRKGKRAGQRLMAALVEIGDDEQPVKQEKPKGGPLSKSAAQMCENQEFMKFWHSQFAGVWLNTEPESEYVARGLRNLCGIKSRAELDHKPEAAKRFHELMREFNAWKPA